MAAAPLEAAHGEPRIALSLFHESLDALHRAGNVPFLTTVLASVAVFFDRLGRPVVAATLYGGLPRQGNPVMEDALPGTVEHLRTVLGATRFDEYVANGEGMELAEAVRYARSQIQLVLSELTALP